MVQFTILGKDSQDQFGVLGIDDVLGEKDTMVNAGLSYCSDMHGMNHAFLGKEVRKLIIFVVSVFQLR